MAIGKFPSVKDERAVTKGEVLASKLAKSAGIAAADAELVHSDGIPVALIRRFDRTSDDERIPYASAATMLGGVRELKTWISEETGPAATVDALLSAAPYFKIKKPRVKAILSEVETAVAGWRDAGRGLGMTKDELDAFADAFEHAERAAARRGR